MKIGITGASGLIGTALTNHLRAGGHEVVRFVRGTDDPPSDAIAWSPADGTLDPADVAPLDAVVHLAGAGIGDKRWTDSYRRTLRDSRIHGTSLIARTMAELGDDGPKILVSGSAIGFYGARGDERLDETSSPGDGFLSDLCVDWEQATQPASDAGVRVAHIRTGIVLSSEGGTLSKLLPLFKLGLGGRFGSGDQWMSWISIDDHVAAVEHLLASDVSGPVNLTAPNPARNQEFVDTLGDVLGRPTWLPVPSFGPRLVVGRDAAEALIFTGQHVSPSVLLSSGFQFEHADLERALQTVTR